MTQHFHSIAPRSPAKAAVRDLQNTTRAMRTSRTTATLSIQGMRGTHIRPHGSEEVLRRQTSSGGIPRWG
jgi:hypothetical protein